MLLVKLYFRRLKENINLNSRQMLFLALAKVSYKITNTQLKLFQKSNTFNNQ